MDRREVILVRHGQSRMNKMHVFAGRNDTELTSDGYKQLKKTSKFIKKRYGGEIIFSSPLKRALNSAKIIQSKLKCPIRIDKRLIETDFGEWEGKSPETLSKLQEWEVYSKDPFHFTFPKGESPQDVKKRILDFKFQILNDQTWNRAVIVSHYTPLVFYILDIFGNTNNFKAPFKLTHGGVTVVEYRDSIEYIRFLNYLP